MAVPKAKAQVTGTYFQKHIDELRKQVCECGVHVAKHAASAQYHENKMHASISEMNAKLQEELFFCCVTPTPLKLVHSEFHSLLGSRCISIFLS